MLHFIGVYNYTVILTYMSLISAIYGITQAIQGNFEAAVISLGVCGVCDAFDGRIARTKKDRTEEEKAFGIQIDSLCDVICFGIFPAILSYQLGLQSILGILIICFYCICAVIRLGYFNVMAEELRKEGNLVKVYHGLPVTMSSILIAITYCLGYIISDSAFLILLHVVIAAIGFLFIFDFKIRKPSFKSLVVFIFIAVVLVISIMTCANIFGV